MAIDTDEFGHPSYKYDSDDEDQRVLECTTVHPGRWIWIRVNPDPNREPENNKTDIHHKIATLIEEIKKQIIRINEGTNDSAERVEMIYLFY